MELAAQAVSPTVLAENRALGRRLNELEHRMDSAKEQLKLLNYENLLKDALLRACTDGKPRGTVCDSRSCVTSNEAIPYSTLCKKVKTLEEENARLQKEASTLHKRVTSAATESRNLTIRCMHELEEARLQMEELSRALKSKTEQCNKFRSERAAMQQLLGDAHGHAKQLATENVELEEYLRTAKDAQAELRSEICELKEKYSDYYGLIATLQEKIAKEKQKTLTATVLELEHAHRAHCETQQLGSKATPRLEAISQSRLPTPTMHSRLEQTRRVRRRSRQRSRVNRRSAVLIPDPMSLVCSLNVGDCFRVAFAAPALARKAGPLVFPGDDGHTNSEAPATCSHFGVSIRQNYGRPMPLHTTFPLINEYKVIPRCAFCKNVFFDDPGKHPMLMPFEASCNCRLRRELVTPSRLEAALTLIFASGTKMTVRSDAGLASTWTISVPWTPAVANGCSMTSENGECSRRKNCFFLRLLEPSLKAWRALRQTMPRADMERQSNRPHF